jgi:hypothetical protein
MVVIKKYLKILFRMSILILVFGRLFFEKKFLNINTIWATLLLLFIIIYATVSVVVYLVGIMNKKS